MNHREIYASFLGKLDNLFRGKSVEGLESTVQKVFLGIANGCPALGTAELDKSNKVAQVIEKYCRLKSGWKHVEVAGVKREMAPETEILEALTSVQTVLEDLVLPHFQKPVDLVKTLVHENANLSLGYVWSVTQSAGEGYISIHDRYQAKLDAMEIARQSLDIQRRFYPEHPNSIRGLRARFPNVRKAMKWAHSDFLRPFASSFTTPKNMTHKNKDIEKVCDAVLGDKYLPDFILPIAHGGVEMGLLMDLAYRDRGVQPITYPVLFSIKTRRHAKPLIEGDDPMFTSLPKANVLLVEDWITTGNTMRGVCTQVDSYFPNDLRIATIKQDPRSLNIPLVKRYKIYAGIIAEYKGSKTDAITRQ